MKLVIADNQPPEPKDPIVEVWLEDDGQGRVQMRVGATHREDSRVVFTLYPDGMGYLNQNKAFRGLPNMETDSEGRILIKNVYKVWNAQKDLNTSH